MKKSSSLVVCAFVWACLPFVRANTEVVKATNDLTANETPVVSTQEWVSIASIESNLDTMRAQLVDLRKANQETPTDATLAQEVILRENIIKNQRAYRRLKCQQSIEIEKSNKARVNQNLTRAQTKEEREKILIESLAYKQTLRSGTQN